MLKRLGLPVNGKWDGISKTLLPVNPCEEGPLYYPSEAYLQRALPDEKSLAFSDELNSWLEQIREL